MRYLGGKARVAKQLTSFLESVRKEGQLYVEPFLGGCNILPLMNNPRIGSEINADLIAFYTALRDGWIPPKHCSEYSYQRVKRLQSPCALKGFIGIACSFSGKWWGGYARGGKGRDYCTNGHNVAMRKKPLIQNVSFASVDYRCLEIPDNSLVYCDPPYKETQGYNSGGFDSLEFWEWARELSKRCDVYVSEYQAPEDFECVWQIERNMEMQTKAGKPKRLERLFKWKGDNS